MARIIIHVDARKIRSTSNKGTSEDRAKRTDGSCLALKPGDGFPPGTISQLNRSIEVRRGNDSIRGQEVNRQHSVHVQLVNKLANTNVPTAKPTGSSRDQNLPVRRKGDGINLGIADEA